MKKILASSSRFVLFALLVAPLPFSVSSAAYAQGVSQDYVNILEGRIQALEDQVKTLTNQVEQSQYQARSAQERLARVEEDMNTRFRMLEDKVSSAPPAAAPDNMAATAGGPVSLTAEGTARANPDAQRLGQLTSGDAPVMPDDPNVAYDQAFQKIRSGDYEAAESALRAFLQKWPNNELSSNASYWLGETFYVRGDYPSAAKAFAEGYQAYPKGAKAEDTMLKLGLTLSLLNRKSDACVTFGQLLNDFPRMGSTNRRRVEQEQAQLNCSSSSAAPASTSGSTGGTRVNNRRTSTNR